MLQDRLQAVCEREGLGIPWIARARAEGGENAIYALKGALYALKGTLAMEEHLALNGSRLAHWSRGFWPMRYRDCIKHFNLGGSDPGPWVREQRLRPSQTP